jgi:hypothetical protein
MDRAVLSDHILKKYSRRNTQKVGEIPIFGTKYILFEKLNI